MRLPGLDLPAGNIFCIGRNYVEHAKELGNAVPSSPLVFLKPTSALCGSGSTIELPAESQNVHHELEVVVAIGQAAKNIAPEQALSVVAGFAVGIDVTARDLQDQAKAKGNPWTLAKGLPTFAPVSAFVPATLPLEFSLTINGERRQTGSTADMVFSIPTLIAYLSRVFTLGPGDLIFTGTPSGVGPLHDGDQIEAILLPGRATLSLAVRRSAST
jgi:2-keto-4-pentenoate hydratase/2-oxohepta-3-ene-1,7-dioic acid hydratase in catechol pathway